MQPTSLAVTSTAPGADAPDAPAAPPLTLAADTRSVSPQPKEVAIDSANTCGVVNRRRSWRRTREGRIGRKTVEVVAKERVAGVVEARTRETAARAVLGRALGAVRGEAPVDRTSASGVIPLKAQHALLV